MKAEEGVATPSASASPTLALALGGGGARGLAHVVVFEALDELGLRPTAMSGASIGAVMGAAFAAGMSALDIRVHILHALRSRSSVMANLLRARVGRFTDLLLKGGGNPVQLDAQICLDLFWPAEVPDYFSGLQIPFHVVAADFHACEEVVFSSGALGPPVAGSIAIPGLFRPVEFDDRVLVDGGAVNPLPYDLLFGHADLVLAVDVTFGGRMRSKRLPTAFGAMFGAGQIMQGSITAQKIRLRPPDILIRPPVERFGMLEFMRAAQILRAAETAKDEIKRRLEARIEAWLRA